MSQHSFVKFPSQDAQKRRCRVQSFINTSDSNVYTIADFASANPDARFVSAPGAWLNSPVVVLKASIGDCMISALTLSFKAAIQSVKRTALLPGGTADRMASRIAHGLASDVLTAAPADGVLTDVGLFIDQNAQSLQALGHTEAMMMDMDGSSNDSSSSDSSNDSSDCSRSSSDCYWNSGSNR
ncbi:hypothetical protein WJX81_001831 [Elliptochloris bilobata]|uniref:Uncharacterized protein n=1 Tax=Elliptochloris bilobata TaxID=381761 RepID=A0AAW1R388_9CHLO